jgi:integrase
MARKSIDDIRQRANWWKDKLGDKAAKSILKSDIESARLDLAHGRFPGHRQEGSKKGRSVATVNRYLATLKAVFLMAMENEKVDKNPFRKVKLQKENNSRVRFLSEDEESRLFSVLPKIYHNLVLVALHTGIRLGEQLRIRWEDINFAQRLLTVKDSKPGEGRHIPLNESVLETLQAIPRMINCPCVFYTEEGKQRKQLPRQWKKWVTEAGIEDFHWHDPRHNFASRSVMAGVDLYSVKELLGHQSIEMTQRYAHLSPNHLKQAVEVLVPSPPELTAVRERKLLAEER